MSGDCKKVQINQFITGTSTISNNLDVSDESKVRFVVEGAAGGNAIAVRGKITGQSTWSTLATLSGTTNTVVNILTYDLLQIECTSYVASGVDPVKLVASSFNDAGGSTIETIGVTSGDTLTDVSAFSFTSADSSVVITGNDTTKEIDFSVNPTFAPVTSVNTQTGAVVLDTDDVAEGASNKYFSDERAQDAIGTALTNSSKISFTYNDIANTISSTIVANSLADADIANLAAINATKIADGSISNTEFQYLNNVSSNIQTQLDNKATHVLPSTTQAVYVNYVSGSDITGDGSWDNPFQTIVSAMASITDADQNKPYVIALTGARQVETADILVKPYVSIVGMGQRATYIRAPGFNIKPSSDHSTSSSWNLFKNFYLGGGTGFNWDLQALGGQNCVLVLENLTIGGSFTFKGRNAGGGDFIEAYTNLIFGAISVDSCGFQFQTAEALSTFTATDTQGSNIGMTINDVVFNDAVSLSAGNFYQLRNITYLSTLTTLGTLILDSCRGLPKPSQRSFSGGTTVVNRDDATILAFSPTTPANWTTSPDQVGEALDELAARTTEKYSQAFNNTTDWGSPSGGFYTIAVPFSSHGINNPIVQIFEDTGSDFVGVTLDSHVDGSNNLSFKVSSTPDLRFTGKYTIV